MGRGIDMEKHNPMEAFGWYANMKEAVVKQYLRGEITRGEMQRKLADIEMEKKRRERMK
jgi:hypothetical protein